MTTRAEPETVSRLALPPPRPSCPVEIPGGDETRPPAPAGNGHLGSSNHHPESRTEHPESSIENPASSRPPRRVCRNGKIARLPYVERDMVNRMLRDHIPHPKIVDALKEHGFRVTQRNISNWKTRGGYREWCAEQDQALETRLLQDNLIEHLRKNDASQLPEVGLQLAATELSRFFLKPEIRGQLATDPEKFARTIWTLCRLTRQIFNLQKYRDDSAKELGYKFNPERVRREAEKSTEITREVYSSYLPPNAPIDPEVPYRNFIPKQLSPELPPSPD